MSNILILTLALVWSQPETGLEMRTARACERIKKLQAMGTHI